MWKCSQMHTGTNLHLQTSFIFFPGDAKRCGKLPKTQGQGHTKRAQFFNFFKFFLCILQNRPQSHTTVPPTVLGVATTEFTSANQSTIVALHRRNALGVASPGESILFTASSLSEIFDRGRRGKRVRGCKSLCLKEILFFFPWIW